MKTKLISTPIILDIIFEGDHKKKKHRKVVTNWEMLNSERISYDEFIRSKGLYTIDEVVKAVNTWAISPVDKHNIEISLNRD